MEVQIQHLDAGLFKELIDEGNGFSAVAEANLHALDGIDANDLLQQHQGNQHQRAAAQRQPIIAVARHNAQARGVPQGGGSCQAGDLLALSEDGARAQEADAADDLRAQTAKVVGDVAAGGGVDVGSKQAFSQGNHARAKAYQHVRAQTGRTVFILALRAHHAADQHGHKNADQQVQAGQLVGMNQTERHGKKPR